MSDRKQLATLLLVTTMASSTVAAMDSNFPNKKAIVLNISPHVQLKDFNFGNEYEDRRYRFKQKMTWKNIGSQPIIAFEIVVLRYDAFDQRQVGSRWVVTGHNSADWEPLSPGEESSDGTSGIGIEDAFTEIAYVRSSRLADGTIWHANEGQLITELRKVAPGIKEIGSPRPDSKPAKD